MLINSCSISCYKKHKLVHETLTSHPPSERIVPSNLAPAKTSGQSYPDIQSKQSLQLSAQALPTSPQYEALLDVYPNLRSDLLKVYKATLQPPQITSDDEASSEQNDRRRGTRGRGRRRGRGGSRSRSGNGRGEKHSWEPERGRKKALRLLKQMSEQNQGMKEFGETVKVFMQGEADEKVADKRG